MDWVHLGDIPRCPKRGSRNRPQIGLFGHPSIDVEVPGKGAIRREVITEEVPVVVGADQLFEHLADPRLAAM